MNRIGKRKRTLRGRICSKRNIVLRNDIGRKRLRKSTRPRVHPLEAGSQGARHRKRTNTIAQVGKRTRNNPVGVRPEDEKTVKVESIGGDIALPQQPETTSRQIVKREHTLAIGDSHCRVSITPSARSRALDSKRRSRIIGTSCENPIAR